MHGDHNSAQEVLGDAVQGLFFDALVAAGPVAIDCLGALAKYPVKMVALTFSAVTAGFKIGKVTLGLFLSDAVLGAPTTILNVAYEKPSEEGSSGAPVPKPAVNSISPRADVAHWCLMLSFGQRRIRQSRVVDDKGEHRPGSNLRNDASD